MLTEGVFLRNFSGLLILASRPAAAATLPLGPGALSSHEVAGAWPRLSARLCETVILPKRMRTVDRRGFYLIPNAKLFTHSYFPCP